MNYAAKPSSTVCTLQDIRIGMRFITNTENELKLAKKLHNLCDVVVVVVDVERGPAIKCHLRVRRHRHQYMRSIYSFFSVFFSFL